MLPAQRIDAAGRVRVDLRAILLLAAPLIANSAMQTVLNLTDTWFIGRLSTQALAAISAVHWLVLAVFLLLSGVGMAVQTLVAQSFGARRYTRGAQAVWTALWGILFVVPLFVAAGSVGHWILAPFGLDPEVQALAVEYWLPRVAGSPFGAACWAVLGFFNGIGRPRYTLMVSAFTVVANALLNQLFIFEFGWGISGSAWATNAAQALGLSVALGLFLKTEYRRRFASHLTWRFNAGRLGRQFVLGFPMGLLYAADLLGAAFFQIMQVRLSPTDGAATQIAMMLTSIAYLPGVGIAIAGTTLVGQSIGAGDKQWAMRVGTRAIAIAAVYMGGMGLLIALAGPWLMPLFVGSHDASSAMVIASGVQILWLAAAYQFFDGMNLGSGFCLRGAGDSAVPAVLVLVLSWLIFVPLTHTLIFAPGEGWIDGLPQAGMGLIGGWIAIVVYVLLLGTTLFIRWRSGAWKRIELR